MLDSPITAPIPAGEGAAPGRAARTARRWSLVAAPVLAGLLAVAGAAADPAVDLDGRQLYRLYADNPEALQFKSLSYHFSYAFWGVAALLLAWSVRGRGAWPAHGAVLLASLGATSLPGFLLADFYDSGIGQAFGVEGNVAVEEAMSGMWALQVMRISGVADFLLCLPVAALAAWRGGLVPWWAPVGVVAGIGGGFVVVGANVSGALT
ncbi:hypothetical protein [Blastococcus saxobsidens]|uniref:Uncharacterized protein n=1 Tax=Blastococcus saxobsidens (strain DD2) TaxID=1146883 RepID=H6RUJ3_BLASD|nr:hypothetical protein [Blastococcus saxobsidens]CCG01958.1 membrane protein of unknown function [Blastococcus saxobsidens DD2]